MAKDYAKYVNRKKRRKTSKKSSRGVLLRLFSLFFITSLLFYFYYKDSSELLIDNINPLFAKKLNSDDSAEKKPSLIKHKNVEGIDISFSFYDELPLNNSKFDTNTSYLIKIAVFENPLSANDYRLSLLLSGFEVDLVESEDKQKKIYQLQKGPYLTIDSAKKIQKQLRAKGIDGIIIKKTSNSYA
ncbi:SPOR domain-containing protein [Gammaproteobacteria bacterium]|nr:SPOR domain-containing protein [Gammaproteobacteria bacterium]